MSEPALPKTLLQMAGADLTPASWEEGALVLIDCQNEYLDGMLKLPGVEAALDQCAKLLARARERGAPVIHIRHQGKAGGAFDWDAPGGAIADAVAAAAGFEATFYAGHVRLPLLRCELPNDEQGRGRIPTERPANAS